MAVRIPLHEGLLTSVEDEPTAQLLGGRCGRCAKLSFPAQTICPYCSADGCASVALSTIGVIEVCTTVVNRPPGYEGPLPFGFGVVELPEGIRLISRIMHPDRSRAGTAVRLVLENVHSDAEGRQVVTYAFAPEEH